MKSIRSPVKAVLGVAMSLGRGVQINLLKLMEETEVNLFSPSDMMAQMQAVMEIQRGRQAEA
jgi:hypothetical protein